MIYDVVMYPSKDQSMQIHSVLEYDELVLYTRVYERTSVHHIIIIYSTSMTILSYIIYDIYMYSTRVRARSMHNLRAHSIIYIYIHIMYSTVVSVTSLLV